MSNEFFEKPILNSPYEYPGRHWELDESGQPTQKIINSRRRAEFITPIPKPRKRRPGQKELSFGDESGISTEDQRYDPTPFINQVRSEIEKWRMLPNANNWGVTPETARLLKHWRSDKFQSIRPFFCQVEAVEVAIWLTEVAPQLGKIGKGILQRLSDANEEANPGLNRLALKLAPRRRFGS